MQQRFNDLLYGAKAIAEHLGINQRKAFHLIETDRLPHFRIGRNVCARRSTLETWISEQEARSRAGTQP